MISSPLADHIGACVCVCVCACVCAHDLSLARSLSLSGLSFPFLHSLAYPTLLLSHAPTTMHLALHAVDKPNLKLSALLCYGEDIAGGPSLVQTAYCHRQSSDARPRRRALQWASSLRPC